MSDAPKRPTREMIETAMRAARLVANPQWGWLADEIDALRGAARADDERLRAAGLRVDLFFGCDTPDAMADEIEAIRADCKALAAECRCSRQYDNLLHTCDRDPTRPCRACEAAQALEAARVATNASGALARHGGGA